MSKERQAELKLAYKLNPPSMGIFAVRHVGTDKAMIGGSRNVSGILNRHRFDLKLGKHSNRALQGDWRASGEPGFAFEVLELVKPREDPDFDCDAALAEALQRWQQKFPPGAANSYL